MITWLRVFSARVQAMMDAHRLDRDLEEELRSHIEMETEANVRRGMSPAQARRQALLEFGGVAQTAELYREGRAIAWIEALAQDIRFALRGFERAPGFTAVAILSLGLGIGVNIAIFSMVNMLLLRPLPVQDAGRLAVLTSYQKGGFPMPVFSYADYRDIREQTAGEFSDLLAYYAGLDGLSVDGRADRIMTHYVTGNYFTLLGLKPSLGRVILPSEGKVEGADPVLVLGYSYWKARLAGDPNVIGKRVLINGHPVTVVGVAPAQFHGAQALVSRRAGAGGYPRLCAARDGIGLGGISQYLGQPEHSESLYSGPPGPGRKSESGASQAENRVPAPCGGASERSGGNHDYSPTANIGQTSKQRWTAGDIGVLFGVSGAGAGARLYQPGKSLDGARRRTAKGDRHACGAGWFPQPADPAIANRKFPAHYLWRARRRAVERLDLRRVGQPETAGGSDLSGLQLRRQSIRFYSRSGDIRGSDARYPAGAARLTRKSRGGGARRRAAQFRRPATDAQRIGDGTSSGILRTAAGCFLAHE
jgi:hypothetical protein